MQVITLNTEDLEAHAARLAKTVEESGDTLYDAIVAVRRGGSYVCDAFLRHFPRDRYGARYDITLQRPSTRHKEGKLKKLLKTLPYPVLDTLRIAESRLLSVRRRIKGASPSPRIKVPIGLKSVLTETPKPKILMIDDAIDSGDTLRAIFETLREMNHEAGISIAVITETTSHPSIRSNYTLYRNRTLIRFPWSNDYKKN